MVIALLGGLAYVVGLTIELTSLPPPLPSARPTSTNAEASSNKALRPKGHLDGNVQGGKLVRKVSPSYPELAREMRWRPPFVNMEVAVGEDGRVANVKITRGHPLCDNAVKLAVSQWKYTPTLINGNPVGVIFRTSLRCGDPYHGKLDPEVAVLIDRIHSNGSASPGEFAFVHNGIANLNLTMSDSQRQNMEKLRMLGFVASEPTGDTKLVIGYLKIQSLDALRALPCVTFISPHRP